MLKCLIVHCVMKIMFKDVKLDQIKVPLNRIIPFSNVEGIGNRTSIFLQGCNINCLFCHNPETIPMSCSDAKEVSLEYLLSQIKASMPFIRGITVSGGEPTLHYQKLIPLFEECHKLGLTCYLDSNGFFDCHQIRELLDVTDKILFDIKGVGAGLEKICFDYQNTAGGQNTEEVSKPAIMYRNVENLKQLLLEDKIEEVRFVHCKGFYDADLVVKTIAEILRDYPHVLFKLIRVHAKGARDEKFMRLHTPSLQEHQRLEQFARELGLNNIFVIN